jgi:hypothetical protein
MRHAHASNARVQIATTPVTQGGDISDGSDAGKDSGHGLQGMSRRAPAVLGTSPQAPARTADGGFPPRCPRP